MDKPRFCCLSEIGSASSDELELHSRLTIKTLLNVKRDLHDDRLDVAIHFGNSFRCSEPFSKQTPGQFDEVICKCLL